MTEVNVLEQDPDPPPQPVPDPDSAGFWEATARGELAIRRCQECQVWCHPPLERCRECGGVTEYERVSGDGTLCSFIVVHQPAVPGFRDRLPYVIGLIELVEQKGLRLATRIEGTDPDHLWANQAMRATIVPHPGGDFRIPVFSPVAEAAPAS